MSHVYHCFPCRISSYHLGILIPYCFCWGLQNLLDFHSFEFPFNVMCDPVFFSSSGNDLKSDWVWKILMTWGMLLCTLSSFKEALLSQWATNDGYNVDGLSEGCIP